eukprot:TRINITY_DN6682_c0_g1_i1.p1 TRINITY_DN6682_c0_g1~~TRINITY_DN6682_c0_g1_i1.p1  ORF type:complete len:446 (+),score=90.39 TRINITY_DN6682_c0_g1_i1:83-1420(+)
MDINGFPKETNNNTQGNLYRNSEDRPIYKLTINLLNTYQHINKVFTSKSISNNNNVDDNNGDYIFKKGDIFDDRYIIEKKLGKGSFGMVVAAIDQKHDKKVAIKIIKNRKPFYNQGLLELKILKHLNKADPEDKYNNVKLYKHFVYKNHLCLVFELLSYNLYDLLRMTEFKGISLGLIKKLAHQILTNLYFLSSQKIGVLHCDLKPENILLRHHKRSLIKVIDFGSSCYLNEKIYKYIQSRFYRAPEVILENSYDHAIDIWSLGCILVELYNGEPLFPGEDEKDQLKLIIEVLGYPPLEQINRSPKALKFFTQGPKGEAILKKSKSSSNQNRPVRNVNNLIKFSPKNNDDPNELTNFMNFRSLLLKMLKVDPSQRISAVDALRHEFFTMRTNNDTQNSPNINNREPLIPIKENCHIPSPQQKNLLNGHISDDMDTSISPIVDHKK